MSPGAFSGAFSGASSKSSDSIELSELSEFGELGELGELGETFGSDTRLCLLDRSSLVFWRPARRDFRAFRDRKCGAKHLLISKSAASTDKPTKTRLSIAPIRINLINFVLDRLHFFEKNMKRAFERKRVDAELHIVDFYTKQLMWNGQVQFVENLPLKKFVEELDMQCIDHNLKDFDMLIPTWSPLLDKKHSNYTMTVLTRSGLTMLTIKLIQRKKEQKTLKVVFQARKRQTGEFLAEFVTRVLEECCYASMQFCGNFAYFIDNDSTLCLFPFANHQSFLHGDFSNLDSLQIISRKLKLNRYTKVDMSFDQSYAYALQAKILIVWDALQNPMPHRFFTVENVKTILPALDSNKLVVCYAKSVHLLDMGDMSTKEVFKSDEDLLGSCVSVEERLLAVLTKNLLIIVDLHNDCIFLTISLQFTSHVTWMQFDMSTSGVVVIDGMRSAICDLKAKNAIVRARSLVATRAVGNHRILCRHQTRGCVVLNTETMHWMVMHMPSISHNIIGAHPTSMRFC